MWRRNQSLDFTEPDGWTVKVCLLQAFMFLKSHHLYTNKKLLQSKYTFSLLFSPLWFHGWWLRFGVQWFFSSKQHFLLQTLFSSQTAVLPKSFSSVFNVFIKDVFVNLWSGLVFSSLFFWYRLEPEKKAGRESQLHLDSTSQPVGFTPHFWRTKSKVQAHFQSHLLNWDTWFNSSLFSVCSTFIRFRMFHFVCSLL